MSYCKITVSGKEVGLRFAHLSNKWFMVALFENGEAYSQESGFTDLGWAKLLHCAYKNDCAIKELKPELTVEDFYNHIDSLSSDEQGQKDFLEAVKVWSETQATKELVKKIEELTGKTKKSKKK
jgi:hypothetical protein